MISLSLGVFFIWIVWRTLTPSDIESIKNSFYSANYWWILLSLILGIASHLSRAYRWKYTLQPLGLKPRFWNSFFAVMIGYLLNLAFPRLGEVSRCGAMSTYEKMPVNKLLGTVIAERVADLIILITLTTSIIFLQIDVLKDLIMEMVGPFWEGLNVTKLVIVLFLLIIGGFGFILFLIKKADNPFVNKVKLFVFGLIDGVRSILTMDNKLGFLGHTLFIWFMYIAMFYVAMLSLPETSNVSLIGVIAGFVVGGMSIVFVQGGLGVYPAAIMAVLLLYGVERNDGLALGWIMWTGQTLLLLILGFVSLALMPIYNKTDESKSNT